MDSDYIAHHLRSGAKTNPHDITHANYNEKYMKLQNERSKNPFGKKIKKEIVNNDFEHKQTDLSTDVNALNDDIDNVVDPLNGGDSDYDTEAVTVESFRKFLDSLSIDGEEIRFPALEALINLKV